MVHPHHGVYHPRKPAKIRVVFDCSAEFQGESLNRHLLQGPDLTNTLIGVLSRFRQEKTAFLCDIESVFLQVRVSEIHRDYLRFLRWDQGDVTKEPQEYRMNACALVRSYVIPRMLQLGVEDNSRR